VTFDLRLWLSELSLYFFNSGYILQWLDLATSFSVWRYIFKHLGNGSVSRSWVQGQVMAANVVFFQFKFLRSDCHELAASFSVWGCKRSGYWSPDLPACWLVEEGDERLFRRINNNSSHVLRELLSPPSMATQQYNLRRRPHDRQMPDHTGHLTDRNFLIRMLFKDSYWLFYVVIVYSQVSAYAFCHVLIKKGLKLIFRISRSPSSFKVTGLTTRSRLQNSGSAQVCAPLRHSLIFPKTLHSLLA